MLGIPLDGPAWLFGDNKAMIISATLPEGKLTKRSIALAYHKVREQVANGTMHYFHINGVNNLSDCLTKALTHKVLWRLIKPILFSTDYEYGIHRPIHKQPQADCNYYDWGVTTHRPRMDPDHTCCPYPHTQTNTIRSKIHRHME